MHLSAYTVPSLLRVSHEFSHLILTVTHDVISIIIPFLEIRNLKQICQITC